MTTSLDKVLREEADQIVCVATPRSLRSIGKFDQRFAVSRNLASLADLRELWRLPAKKGTAIRFPKKLSTSRILGLTHGSRRPRITKGPGGLNGFDFWCPIRMSQLHRQSAN